MSIVSYQDLSLGDTVKVLTHHGLLYSLAKDRGDALEADKQLFILYYVMNIMMSKPWAASAMMYGQQLSGGRR